MAGLPQETSGWRKLARISGWLIGAAASYIFLKYYFDWTFFCSNISKADWTLLSGFVGAYILGLLVRAVRWTFMVRCHQPLSWIQGYHVIMISNFVNFLFPVRLGEILKLVIVKKSFGINYCSSTAASIIEKLTLFLIIVVFLSLAPFVGYHFSDWSAKFLPFLGLLLFVSAIFLFFGTSFIAWNKKIIESFLKKRGIGEDRLQRILANNLLKYIEDTMSQCHYSSYSGWRFLWIAVMGFSALALDGIANYCLLSAFGLQLTLLQAMIAASFFNMLFLLPSPPAQVGTAEMFPIVIYTAGLKLSGPVVASSAIVCHMLSVVILALLGLVSLYAVGLRISTVAKMAYQSPISRGGNI